MISRHRRQTALAVLLGLTAPGSQAGVLERVRAQGVLHCAAEPRTGLAEDAGDGTLAGIAVALCRAVATTVLGASGRVAFQLQEPGRAPDATAELAFTSNPQAPAVATVFRGVLALLVGASDPARRPQDLAGRPVCFMIGSDAEAALDAAAHAWRLDILHMAYEEEDEMADAFAAHRCAAVAAEAQEMPRFGAGRVLLPPLARFSVAATTPSGDAAWAGTVREVWEKTRH